MAGRRDRGKVVVDLVETTDPAAADDAPDVDGARPTPPAGMTRRQRLVQAAVAVGAIVVLGGGLGLTGAVREHARVDRLSHAPGGVLSLDRPPRPVWTAKADTFAPVGFLPGVVVQQRSDEVVGLDAATGTERWSVPLPAEPTTCGAWDGAAVDRVHDRLVCVSGSDDTTRSVVVLDRSGPVATRDVTGPFDAILPTADGGLVTVTLVGPDPAPVPVTRDATNGWTAGPVEHGYDASVHAEDAATGKARWDVTVPFRPVDDPVGTGLCLAGDPDGTPRFRPRTLSTRVDSATFVLFGCGLQATITLGGSVLDHADIGATMGIQGAYTPYADGGILGTLYSSDGTAFSIARTVLYDASGAAVQAFGDELLDPMATDGTDTDVRITRTGGSGLRATDADGAVRWSVATSATTLLVRAGGVAVVQDPLGTVTGLDLRTGATRWTSQEWVSPARGVAAFTDGRTALIASGSSDPQATTVALLALDLRTGAVRWHDELQGTTDVTALSAAGGRLVEEVPTSVTQETSPDGAVTVTWHGQALSVLR